MANALGVYVGQASKQLVHIQPDEGPRNRLLALGILTSHFVHGLGDELQDEVQVDLVLLLARRVEEVHELDYVAVLQASHDLQLTVFKPLVL